MKQHNWLSLLLGGAIALSSSAQAQEPGTRMRATGGVAQVEGAAGGGLVPWAVISGYGQTGEWNSSFFVIQTNVDDISTTGVGANFSYGNRFELSYTQQDLNLSAFADALPVPTNGSKLEIYGAKVRLFGDLIYSDLPQVSVGAQFKTVDKFINSEIIGAEDDHGTDFYVAASKLFLNGVGGYPIFVNATVRLSDANELGFLGYGGDDEEGGVLLEGTLGVLLSRDIIVGFEYREKNDNTFALNEDDWKDLFVSWFPSKNLSITAAYLDLGEVVTEENQSGFYVSLQATF